jgi:hypothetical protein
MKGSEGSTAFFYTYVSRMAIFTYLFSSRAISPETLQSPSPVMSVDSLSNYVDAAAPRFSLEQGLIACGARSIGTHVRDQACVSR